MLAAANAGVCMPRLSWHVPGVHMPTQVWAWHPACVHARPTAKPGLLFPATLTVTHNTPFYPFRPANSSSLVPPSSVRHRIRRRRPCRLPAGPGRFRPGVGPATAARRAGPQPRRRANHPAAVRTPDDHHHRPGRLAGRRGHAEQPRAQRPDRGPLGQPRRRRLLHCPGQLAIYPIVPLRWHGFSVGEFLDRFQTGIVETLDDLNVPTTRFEQTPPPDNAHPLQRVGGVWGRTGQLAALGVAVRHWITYYGAYLNVCPPMGLFRLVGAVRPPKMSSLVAERCGPVRMTGSSGGVGPSPGRAFRLRPLPPLHRPPAVAATIESRTAFIPFDTHGRRTAMNAALRGSLIAPTPLLV